MKKTNLSFVLGLLVAGSAFAQTDGAENSGSPPPPQAAPEEPILLPTAEISADKETTEHITREQMDERGDSDLWEAMRRVPGVVRSNGSQRNESAFTLRGFDATSVPVYVDGVPWIDPSRGQVDYARFLSGDLESIDIMKGYSSVLFGPNNLGGAVVMRLAKPKKAFEANLKTSWDFDGGGYAGNLETLSIGTKQKLFYGKASFQWRDVDHYRLPDSFEPSDDNEPGSGGNPQKKGDRLWSDSKDLKVSALFGWTPFDSIDVWASYAYSDADKGYSPPENTTSYRVWNWPYIRRHTVTLNGALKTDDISANALVYFDKFDNRLDTYPAFGGSGVTGDGAWAAYLSGTHTTSDYDDYTTGLNLDGAYKINNRNKIQAAFQFRQTSHKVYDGLDMSEHKDDEKTTDILENLWFGGLEYSINPVKPFTAVVGIGIDIFDPQELWRQGKDDKMVKSPALPQWSAGLFYDLAENHELHLTYAKKNRFPTIFERTSTQGSGTNKPNLELKPVQTNTVEFGYKGYFLEKINITTAAYYSYVYDQITRISITDDPNNYTTMYDNIDKTAFYGFEFASEMYLTKFFSLGGALGVNKYDIVDSEADNKYLGNSPELTANGYLVIKPFENIDTKQVSNIKVVPSYEYVGSRYASTSETPSDILTSYSLAHLKLSADITEYFTLSFAVNNLFDELYEIRQYFPQAGRSFNLTLEGHY